MRKTVVLVIVATLGACGGSESPGSRRDASAGGTSPAGGRDGTAVRSCADRQLIVAQEYSHHFATDRQSYYWFGSGGAGIAIYALPKAGGTPRIVTSFGDAFAYAFGTSTLPVSADAQILMSDLAADDLDDYLYFSGDTQMWRAKKDGSEPVQAVSGKALNDLVVATCNFSRSQLTATGLYTCRSGRIFRMSRAGDGQAQVLYSAPSGSTINGLAVDGSYAYVNGPYSEERHLAPLLKVSLASGEATEVGQMIEGLVPDALFLVGQNLVFSSLTVLKGPDLATTNEWAKRQGTYRIGPSESTPTKISEEDILQVSGAGADATDVYTATGDHTIARISMDGTTRTFVDCTDYQGPEGEMLIYDFWVDADGVYVRDIRNDSQYWRFAK